MLCRPYLDDHLKELNEKQSDYECKRIKKTGFELNLCEKKIVVDFCTFCILRKNRLSLLKGPNNTPTSLKHRYHTIIPEIKKNLNSFHKKH